MSLAERTRGISRPYARGVRLALVSGPCWQAGRPAGQPSQLASLVGGLPGELASELASQPTRKQLACWQVSQPRTSQLDDSLARQPAREPAS